MISTVKIVYCFDALLGRQPSTTYIHVKGVSELGVCQSLREVMSVQIVRNCQYIL